MNRHAGIGGSAVNPVARAAADGIKPLHLAVAAHEIGHGIVWRHYGFPIKKMVLQTGLFGGISRAYCRRGDLWLDASNIEGFLVGLAAGAAAQLRCATTFLGHGPGRAASDARSGARDDHTEFRRLARAHNCKLSIDAAEVRASSILTSHADLLDRLTAQLARTGHISGRAL